MVRIGFLLRAPEVRIRVTIRATVRLRDVRHLHNQNRASGYSIR